VFFLSLASKVFSRENKVKGPVSPSPLGHNVSKGRVPRGPFLIHSGQPAKYLAALDKPTRERINTKLEAIAKAPYDTRRSYPLVGQTKRSSPVGGQRILFEIVGNALIVSDTGPRRQVYKRM
jgi:hypothetical protein